MITSHYQVECYLCNAIKNDSEFHAEHFSSYNTSYSYQPDTTTALEPKNIYIKSRPPNTTNQNPTPYCDSIRFFFVAAELTVEVILDKTGIPKQL